MAFSKVILNGTTLMDVTNDTVVANKLLSGYTATGADGEPITGSYVLQMKMGIIRPDAELLQEWTYDKKIVTDEKVTIPTYTTSATTLLATSNLSPTVTTDRDNYDYFVVLRGLAYPIYASGTTMASGFPEYSLNAYFYEMLYTPVGQMLTLNGLSSNSSRLCNITSMGSMGRLMYWTSSSEVTLNASSTFGAYVNGQTPSVSTNATRTNLTVKAPQLNIRGHATYMSSAAWAAVEDIRYQWVQQLWRVERGHGTNGWTSNSNMAHNIECTNSSTHKLT